MRDAADKKEKNLNCRKAARYYFQLNESHTAPSSESCQEETIHLTRTTDNRYLPAALYAITTEIYTSHAD